MNYWRRKMELEERVYKVLEDISGVKKPSKADMLLEELAFDSLGMVTLLLSLEDEFGIEFDESDLNPFDLKTVGEVVDLIEKYCGE